MTFVMIGFFQYLSQITNDQQYQKTVDSNKCKYLFFIIQSSLHYFVGDLTHLTINPCLWTMFVPFRTHLYRQNYQRVAQEKKDQRNH